MFCLVMLFQSFFTVKFFITNFTFNHLPHLLISHISSLVNKYIEIKRRIMDNNCNSIPNKGKLLNEAVIPNNPIKAGKSPAKQPGHAPPNNPTNIPNELNPCPLWIFLYSLNFI